MINAATDRDSQFTNVAFLWPRCDREREGEREKETERERERERKRERGTQRDTWKEKNKTLDESFNSHPCSLGQTKVKPTPQIHCQSYDTPIFPAKYTAVLSLCENH